MPVPLWKKMIWSLLVRKSFATHDGLSKEYEVNFKELDFLVDEVKNNQNVLYTRIMVGAFGVVLSIW